MRETFAGRVARTRAGTVHALCDEWRPDALVCEEVDFGAVVAAERLGLPHASFLSIASGSFDWAALAAAPLNELRAEHGLPPDPGLEMSRRHLVLSPFPASFRDPHFPLPPNTQLVRPVSPEADAALEDVEGPLVYFTLGTIFNLESGDLFERVLAGLRELPATVVVTTGREVDPAALGPQPSNVRVESYVPQASLLPRCDLVVSHGGSGSVIGALAHGVPMVLLPMGADQPFNAAAARRWGSQRCWMRCRRRRPTSATRPRACCASAVPRRGRAPAGRDRGDAAARGGGPAPRASRRLEARASCRPRSPLFAATWILLPGFGVFDLAVTWNPDWPQVREGGVKVD